MPGKLTRRGLAALAASPLLINAGAGEAQAQTPGAAEDDLAIQRDNLRRWREATRQVKLPRALEPAFVFKP